MSSPNNLELVRGCPIRYSSILCWVDGDGFYHIHFHYETSEFVRAFLAPKVFVANLVISTALYLCIASLLLFIAAILDLGRLLMRGPTKDAQNVDPGVASVFVVAREVGLGLSYGFLFLFIWMAVAQRPKSEQRACAQVSAQDGAQSHLHSASWKRWGVVGLVLKWFTLFLAILISVLQILWRIVSAQRRYGSLYITESTLEIVVSTVFLLKIVLNVLLSPETWWIAFRPYIAFVFALILTAVMGAGNLVNCVSFLSLHGKLEMLTNSYTVAFSETILGRFLRAISIYILLIYSLIRTFDRPNLSQSTPDDREVGSVTLKHEKPKDLIIQTTNLKPALATNVEIVQPSLRVSASSRFSVLVSRGEKKEAFTELARNITPKSTRGLPIPPAASINKPKRSDLHFDIMTPAFPSAKEASNTPEEPPTTGISLTYYTMNFGPPETPNILVVPESTDRPTTSPSSARGQRDAEFIPQISLAQPPARPNHSITSFDELMRQQNELDKSIANLGLLSIDTSGIYPPEVASASESSPFGGNTVASAKSRPQSTLRTDSLSQHSEFSLSIFPLPPPPPPESNKRSSVFLFRKLPQPPLHPPSQVPPSPSIRESPFQKSASERLTSAGTQYDVTSFIYGKRRLHILSSGSR